MRDIEKLHIEYLGYGEPLTEDEAALETLGLKLAIKYAEKRIAHLEQAVKIAEMKQADAAAQKAQSQDNDQSQDIPASEE